MIPVVLVVEDEPAILELIVINLKHAGFQPVRAQSAEEAEAEFLTDEYFEAWYQSLCDALSQYEG